MSGDEETGWKEFADNHLRTRTVIEAEDIIFLNIYFNWARKNLGFGQLSFHRTEDGQIVCNNECLSRKTVKEIMHEFVERLVDNSKFDCERD